MAMRFQWLTRKKRGAGISTGRRPARPIQLLCLEERNSASALYGMEGLVLFSSGSQSATMRVHRSLGDDGNGASVLPAIINETPDQAEHNQGREFSHGNAGTNRASRAQERSKPTQAQARLADALAIGRFGSEGRSELGLIDSVFSSDDLWSDLPAESEDPVTKLWNSFRDKTFAALKSGKADALGALTSGIDSAGSDTSGTADPLRAAASPSLGIAASSLATSLASSWGAGSPFSPGTGGGSFQNLANYGGGLAAGNNPYLASSSGPAELGSNLQNPDRGDQAKDSSNLDAGEDRNAPPDDTASTRLEIQPEKNVTIGPVAPSNPQVNATIASFPAPAVSAVATLPAGGTGFAQGIGVASGGALFGTNNIAGRVEIAPARVSAAPASADLATATINAAPHRSEAGSANGAGSTSGTLDAQSVLFRINRGPGSAHDLQVRYTLKTFDQGSARTVERTAFMAAGQNQLLVVAGEELAGTSAEVATLSVASGPGYQAASSIATRMNPSAQGGVSDAALLEAYRMGGSQDAFDTLVKQYWPGVFRTCHRILGQWADAEDVSQFVFLALTQMQMRFPPPLARWLNRVARNASIGLLRSKKRRERREQIAAKGDLTDSEESAFMAAEVIGTAMEKLPDPLREAVSLRYLDGWSQQEAAQIIGCPRGTLSQRAAHGITRLRTMLTRDSA